MRALLVITIGIAIGIVAGAVGPSAAAMLDTRYRTAGTTTLFVPRSVDASHPPAALVVALPGLGGTGRPMAELFADAAEKHRWLVLAPSPVYERAGEPSAASDARVDYEIHQLIDWAMGAAPRPSASRVFVTGFSRGAQSAHRFALRHPDIVEAVGSMSAGSYTMPTSDATYPIGIGSFATWNDGKPLDATTLRSVRFLVGVGGDDTLREAVPEAWDSVGGTTRVERARRFAAALDAIGVPEHLVVFPGVGHTLTGDMVTAVVDWFSAGR